MRLVLRRQAKLDLVEARRWYEERRPGLGESFVDAVDAVLAVVLDHPNLHPRVSERVRRASVGRFPYGIFYTVNGDTVRVIAVLHNARDPERWKGRALIE
jgi:toxin ParE1/3/4